MSQHENRKPRTGFLGHLRGDILPSIVVFLVALPLCMGIAIASGVPVAAGLVTGIVGGLIVGTLAGSPLQVSGPAAGLTVIVYDLVSRQGVESLGIVVLLAGSIQLLAGLFGLGQWFRAVSPAVIKGMLAGIGVLIFASQFHVMVDDAPKENGLKNLVTIPEALRKGFPWPELGTPEERAFRAEHLKQFGNLHVRQVEIEQDTHETIAEGAEAKSAAPEALARIAEVQETLAADYARLKGELQSFGLTEGDSRQASRLRAATEDADRAIATAVADLREGHPEHVRESQNAAESSIKLVLSRMKNHDWAAKIGLLTIVTIVLWQSLAPRRLKVVPAPLVAIVLATAVTATLSLPVLYVEVPNSLSDDLHMPFFESLTGAHWAALVQAAIVIAIVASAETLLCATAVDQMHTGPRTNYNRELCAQGVGNMTCGFFGGLPMTGVIVRSAANVQAGAKSRWSAVMHGLWLLVFVVVLANLLRMIPIASLAAMLVYTGYKLVDVKSIKNLWKYGAGEVVIYAATLCTIVATDLLKGVIVGIVLSALKLLITFSKLRVDVVPGSTSPTVIRLRGAATFLQLPKLAEAIETVPRGANVQITAHGLRYIDHACLNLLMSWSRQHESAGGNVSAPWDRLHELNAAASEEQAAEARVPQAVHSNLAPVPARVDD